jgi:hypothetical protein
MADFKPVTVAIVRDIHQRAYYSTLVNPIVRPDGWVMDREKREWYSPDNVISLSTFTPRKWDGNGLQPGTLCEISVWLGVTSERPTGYETELVTIISRDAAKRVYTILMSDGTRRTMGEGRLVPVMAAPDAP